MNILQINSYFLGSIFYENLYKALEKQGIKEDIYVYSYKKTTQRFPENVTYAVTYKKINRLFQRSKYKKSYKKMKEIYNIKEYDLLHGNSLFSNGALALLAKKEKGIPFTVSVRSTDINVFFKYGIHLRNLGREILREAEIVHFLSETHKNEVLKHVNKKEKQEILEKSKVIPNGVHEFWHKNSYKEEKTINTPLKALYLGRIERNKNPLATARAIDIIRKKGIDMNFTLIGDCESKGLKRRLESFDFVHILPFEEDRKKLLNYYREHDIYIMPSFSETFGISYPEAMSQGLPIIYTKNQGFDGQIKEGEGGFSVNPHSPEDVARKIINIKENYSYISNKAVENSKKFNWERTAKEMVNLYERAIK